jgi:hypothetical protein
MKKIIALIVMTAFWLLASVSVSAQTTQTGVLRFIDGAGSTVISYAEGTVVHLRLTDIDRNVDGSVVDTVHVRVFTATEVAGEPVVLTETGVGTGVFTGSLATQTATAAVAGDGVLQAGRGDRIEVVYRDPADDFGLMAMVRTTAYYGVTLISGTYSANTTWRKSDAPFLMTGDVTVSQGARLTIEPGVRVLVTPLKDDQLSGSDANRVELRVQGQLIAEGTQADSIRFVSLSDTPTVSDWYGINLDGGSGVVSVAYADIRHATHGIRVSWVYPDALSHFKVLHSTFDQVGSGIYIYGYENIRRLNLEHNTFRNVAGRSMSINYVRQADVMVVGNHSEQSVNGSVYFHTIKSVVFSENSIVTPVGGQRNFTGVEVRNVEALVLQGNTVQRKSTGIVVDGTSSALIRGNLVSDHSSRGIQLQYTTSLVDSNVVRDNGGDGVYVMTDFERPVSDTLRANTITGNGQHGIHNVGHGRTVANFNNLYGNFGYDLYNSSSVWESLDARFNWWGTNTTAVMNTGANPKNIDKIYDRYDNSALAFVNYAGWLDDIGGNPAGAGQTGVLTVINQADLPVLSVSEGGLILIRLTDIDRNVDGSVVDTVHVRVFTATEVAGEPVVLTETGVGTGVFTGSLATQTATAAVAGDGVLQAGRGDRIEVVYRDPADDFGLMAMVRTTAYYGVTLISGTYSANTTWRKSDAPFLMTGDVTVSQGARLTIEPGVRVLVTPLKDDQLSGSDANRVELRVQGQLIAEGTQADSIRFVSLSDTPTVSDWYGINLDGGSGVVSVAYADIRHATHGIRVSWVYPDALSHFKVLHSTFDQVGSGIYIYGYENIRRLNLEHNTFRNVAGRSMSINYVRQADVMVVGNHSEQSVNGSVYFHTIKSVVFSENSIVTPVGGQRNFTGVEVRNVEALVLQGNTVQRKSTGIVVDGTSSALIRGNLVSDHSSRGIQLQYTTSLVDSNVVRDNGGDGVYVMTDFERPVSDTLRANTITGNGQHGIHNVGHGRTVANFNNLYGNFGYDLYNSSSVWESLDARFNWWGTNTTAVMNTGANPKNIDKIYDRYDNGALAFVNYAGWLQQEINVEKPSQVVLISPLSNATGITPNTTFVWNSSDKADTYHLEISEVPSFVSTVFQQENISDTTFIASGVLNFDASYHWRVRGINDSGAGPWSQISAFQTQLLSEVQNTFTAVLSVKTQTNTSINLTIGAKATATDGFDPDLDRLAPPSPPDGIFDARLIGPDESYFDDFRPITETVTQWKVRFSASSSDRPVTISWNRAELPATGAMIIRDVITGAFVSADMRSTDAVTVQDAFVSELIIEHILYVTVAQSYPAGWSLVGMPVNVSHTHYSELFPSAVNNSLYGFANTYLLSEVLTESKGYWVRLTQPSELTFVGDPRAQADLQLSAGWNLISGLSSSVAASSIADTDGIIVAGSLYGFSGSYVNSTTLDPGKGYWVRTLQSGTVRLVAGAAKSASPERFAADGFTSIRFSSQDAVLGELLFAGTLPDSRNLHSFEMPPLPPDGVFDARFEQGLSLLNQDSGVIVLQQNGQPLTIQIGVAPTVSSTYNAGPVGKPASQYLVREFIDSIVLAEHELSDGSEFRLRPAANRLSVTRLADSSDTDMPTEFALEQNFPNPFNPSTTIRYALPEAAQVRLEVFTVAGQRVAVLASGEQRAGWHTASFDGSALASGVYIYRLQAGGFVQTRKLMLIK